MLRGACACLFKQQNRRDPSCLRDIYPISRLKAPQFIDGDERRVPFLGEGMGEGNKARTNALDRESTMLYTEALDETSYKSNRNVCYGCHSHVVWCPKYRRNALVASNEERLKQIIREVCQEHQAE